ncbi:orotidine-5'-phosphate decarboxylase [Melghiribacillus thermohalophilus]|uniref:Orotidine 5'-phosphate decarboxylase n=1 Tax=Melghiribacillus thermohalophilus TaxID=1324956 RepID=A0A4R3NH93_9BACI|nr:orotidine-5'-phosphate decarboxylase [Melghiribacillus thermohalophilus]TCT26838.1 orotidine-5'-phosphate decarboxylase [Melghiribacillus thermohalophilus]
MNKPLYLALDFPDAEKTFDFLKENELTNIPVKVGMQLFYREGPMLIEKLKVEGYSIFLDLKLHDIPNTVKESMKNLSGLGVELINVHAAGGKRMMEAAREGLEAGTIPGQQRPYLIGVTQLTSTDETMLHEELGIQWGLNETIIHYAKLSQIAGADGVVCSVHEVPLIKEACGSSFMTVTPGIRFQSDTTDDQKRVATPGLARKLGSDAIVMGRSITRAPHPKQAYQQAIKEWNHE